MKKSELRSIIKEVLQEELPGDVGRALRYHRLSTIPINEPKDFSPMKPSPTAGTVEYILTRFDAENLPRSIKNPTDEEINIKIKTNLKTLTFTAKDDKAALVELLPYIDKNYPIDLTTYDPINDIKKKREALIKLVNKKTGKILFDSKYNLDSLTSLVKQTVYNKQENLKIQQSELRSIIKEVLKEELYR